MWSSSPAIPTVAPLELISIRIPISPSPTYSSEYEASMINDHTIWKDGDGTCYHETSKSLNDIWKSKSYQPLISPHTTTIPTRVESSQPTLSPYDTCIAPPPSPSPCSPIPHREIRPASTSPVRFTFTPHHILSSQRRAIIIASKQSKQPMQDLWHGDISDYPIAPIDLKLEKKWMTTSISAPHLTNVATSTPTPPVASTPTPTPTPTPCAHATPTPTPTATPASSSTFLTVPTLEVSTPSTPLLKVPNDRTPTPFSSHSSITPSYTTPSPWRSSSSSTPLAPSALPTLSVRISISSPSAQPSTCPMAPRCLDPWITPDQRMTPSMISSY